MATTTNLSSLVINYLTQAQYDAAAQAGTLNENQLYLTPPETLATVATTGSYNDLSNKPTLATVATSGSYNDLTDKPTPLIGTTGNTTPSQVLAAIQAGRPIQISHTDSTYGTGIVTNFYINPSFNSIIANAAFYNTSSHKWTICELMGDTTYDTWNFWIGGASNASTQLIRWINVV